MGSSSTPNIKQYVGNDNNDGITVGRNASSLVGMHGSAAAQAAHIADPTDLATCITRIAAILVVLENKGLTASA